MADHWRTSRRAVGGIDQLSGSHAHLTPRDRINQYFPSGSILAEPIPVLKRTQLSQAIFDVLFVLSAFLFITVTGVGLAFALFALIFLRF